MDSCEKQYATVIFGGSFDPVHFGHLIVARAAAEHVSAERVVLLPTPGNPLKGIASADAAHRLKMLSLAIEGDGLFEICDHEACRTPPTYTIDTIEYLLGRQLYPQPIAFVIGADSLEDFARWRRVDELVELVDIVVMCRPPLRVGDIHARMDAMSNRLGSETVAGMKGNTILVPLIDISSTDIRRRVKEGKSPRYLTPHCVAKYIEKNGLYK